MLPFWAVVLIAGGSFVAGGVVLFIITMYLIRKQLFRWSRGG